MSGTPATRRAPSGLTLRAVERAGEIAAAAWDACAGPDNPTLRHAFFVALEASGSASAEAGWLPYHLALEDGGGRLAGLLPLYLKSHSFGEYVFDQGWAEAYERAGGRYYPKLQAGVPFTPVPGQRLLVRPGAPEGAAAALIAGAQALSERLGVSSLHIVFPSEGEWRALGEAGFLQRTGVQFHWRNADYRNFADFLDALTSRKRKQIKRERREAQGIPGIEIETLEGRAITEAHWDAFYRFYCTTAEKKWGMAYLTREFFSRLGETIGDAVVLMLAKRDGRAIAGALNLLGTNALYGRNWGAIEEHPFLHFELCYYRAIDFAIARGLSRVEAGVQGPHKLFRGYLPVATYSAHFIRDPALKEAVARFLAAERRQVAEERDALEGYAPFRKDGG